MGGVYSSSISSSSTTQLTEEQIESIKSNVWLLCSMQLTLLDHSLSTVTLSPDLLDFNMTELDAKIGLYMQSISEKHLNSKNFSPVSKQLEEILKFCNVQKYSYRLLIDIIKDMLKYLNNLVDSFDGRALEDILSETDMKTK